MESKLSNFPLILLCGGKSSRMGTPKGLLRAYGKPLLLHHATNFMEKGGREIVAILGYVSEKYMNAFSWSERAGAFWHTLSEKDLNPEKKEKHPDNPDLPHPSSIENDIPASIKIRFLINKNPEYGQFSSIKTAVSFLSEADTPGFFVTPVDVPPPSENVFKSMLQEGRANVTAVIPCFQGKGGHPVLLSSDFIDIILKTPLDSPYARLDRQIRAQPKKSIVKISVNDHSVITNLNTPEEFKNYFV